MKNILKRLFYPHIRSRARDYIGYILHEGRIYLSRSSKVRVFGSHLLLSDQRGERRETLSGFLS